ncbi:MAG: TOBE domain-containing protein, partial [Caulobacter sp.]|nr:TOBE domain-containing protein [Vitreoscilla sp.]
QRVAMGRALARNPKLFLFDEPLSNLDAKLRVELRAEIKLLHQRTKTTTVYVTHDQIEAMTLGDRIAVMKDGRVLQLGTPDDIYSRPATRYVAQFIGSPSMNMIPAVRSGTGASANGVELELTSTQREALAASSAGTLTYGLRPEAVRFADDGVPGTLRFTEPTGPETYATVETSVGLLTLRVPGYMAAKIGDAVHVKWTPESVHLFDATTDKRIG